jgi:2'-5' RNA ligase
VSQPPQALDLLLDAVSEHLVRDLWAALDEAGVSSLAGHRSESHRPHVTVAAVCSVPPEAEQRVADLCRAALPLDVRLGPPVVLGRGPWVLARLLVASRALLTFHEQVAAALAVPQASLHAPGRWLPHVTLARRLRIEQVGAALGVPGLTDDADVTLGPARRWDADQRTAWRTG